MHVLQVLLGVFFLGGEGVWCAKKYLFLWNLTANQLYIKQNSAFDIKARLVKRTVSDVTWTMKTNCINAPIVS